MKVFISEQEFIKFSVALDFFDDEKAGNQCANHGKHRRHAGGRKGAVSNRRLEAEQPHQRRRVHDDFCVLQADEADEEANADRNRNLERFGNGVENGFAHIGEREGNKNDAFHKNRSQRHLPTVSHANHDGIGKIGVQSHACRQHKWQVGERRHAERCKRAGKRGGGKDGAGVHAGGAENVGIDGEDIGHGHECRHAGNDLGAYVGAVFLEFEELFHGVALCF